ncbi:MAG: TonB-dependent receptor [Candidatus Marinimicrobia bacterium]|nr:TonB-dependent receptor [Candidatus Neomarinimicrobiota bacterium]
MSIVIGQGLQTVSGNITSKSGEKLTYVNVYFMDTLEGTITDSTGNFSIKTKLGGSRLLRISHIGFEQMDISISVKPEMNEIKVVLVKSFMEMDPVTVSAGSFTMADEEGQTLTSMDIVTTAGAAADIFRAIQTFPGVNSVDEGAGMYVRGGDVSETTVILDQATISHPYKYESDTGGYFGMISPFLLSGTYFSSGGFTAKYGNVLSGVLAMESLDLPSRSSVNIGAGLAALSLGGAWLIEPGKIGIQFSGNYSDTKYLFKVNGGEDRFKKVPISWDGNVSAVYKYSPMGQVKLFHYSNIDEIGVNVITPTFDGIMLSDNGTKLTNIQWRHLFENGLVAKSSLSLNRFNQGMSMGNFSRDMDDSLWKWRTDLSFIISENIKLNAGFIADDLNTVLAMTYPLDQNDLSEAAETGTFDIDYETRHFGFYAETEMNLSRRLFSTFGLRSDVLDNPRQTEIDPRISLNYRLSDKQFLKVASGIYHQYPQAQYRDEWNGNPNLKAMQATHAILGYEYKAEITNLKVELYQKNYTNLVLEDSATNFTNDGHGYAYGADIFLKGNLPIISGWVSYSYLQSQRKELDHLKISPTDYDINHNLTAALKMRIANVNSLGLTYKYTTGKPYTAAKDEWNAERLPPMQRLDLSMSRVYFFGGAKMMVIYGAISNVLDKQNIYGYIYSPDYSERTELKSTHGRNVYLGFSLNL